ncbi:MAG: leucine--tRNA ligase [Candidatus Aminicenantes bacterium]|nr:leucine--tRNA ligase [Candidatus Aminicenantes bacterium]
MNEDYDFSRIEAKWQASWDELSVFKASDDSQRTKYYCLEMYPYPSGRVHMGHIRNFSIVDVISRFKLMRGLNVLHPIGWDAFGMPAENAAIQEGVHPRKWTLDNISHMKRQLKRMGYSYDWSREVTTCYPEYYKWNQWIFLKMLERGLAYRKKSWINFCPECRTVLANEQVISEKCWRCETQVEKKEMEQWFLRITGYAEELLSDHGLLEKWPEHVLTMQKNWIGKSTGAHVVFPVVGTGDSIAVFTTRVDTIFGATFIALSPEHPLSEELIDDSPQKHKFRAWIRDTVRKQRLKEDPGELEKEGIDTGRKAINPYNGEEIPIWISNYVLMEYGTGAIMAVPAHDQRDFEFARKYSIPIREVIVPLGQEPAGELEEAFEGYGMVINSDAFSGMPSKDAMERMTQYAEERGFGQKRTLYKIRDWGISRQRYWGTPIPIIYCKTCGIVAVPYEDLPVELPPDVQFKGEEGSPLESVDSFLRATCPKCGNEGRRETDTMDTFFDSSWYYFRYCSPEEKSLPFDAKPATHWLPVDIYIGGIEHAILHLIYARFFCKVLRDLGLTEISEPFPHYFSQGMVTKDGAKMSKSKGNVVDPDDIIADYGADSLRLFILFASPPEKEFNWSEKGIEGCSRFLNRFWMFFHDMQDLFAEKSPAVIPENGNDRPHSLRVKMHQTIKKVTEDIGRRYHFNTAISSIMELFNSIRKESESLKGNPAGRALLSECVENLVLLLGPFAPHICEELWEKMGHANLLARAPWPRFDPELAQEDTVTIVVQVNGKLRDKFDVERNISDDLIKEEALSLDRIKLFVGEKKVRKIVYIKDKLINIVV